MNTGQISAWQVIIAGGPILIPIFLCSVLAVAVVLERLIYFSSLTVDVRKLKEGIYTYVRSNNLKEAVILCDTHPSPVAKILKAGLLKFGANREDIKESIEEISLIEIPKLEKRLGILATIAHVSVLLGFLGTATGIAVSFYAIQTRVQSLNAVTAADLASGVWQALITTIAGLIVAIPTFACYNYFVDRVNAIIAQMERNATELTNFLAQMAEIQTARKGSYKGEI